MAGLGSRLPSAYGLRKAQTGAIYNRKFAATDKTTAEESIWRTWYFPLGLVGLTASVSLVGPSSVIYAPGLNPGPVSIGAPGIGAATTAFAATLSPGAITATPGYAGPSGAGAFDAALSPGALLLSPSFAASSASIFAPALAPGVVVGAQSFVAPTGAALIAVLAPGPISAGVGFVPSDSTALAVSVVTHGGTHPGFISSGSIVWAPSMGGDDGAYRIIRIRMRRRRRRR